MYLNIHYISMISCYFVQLREMNWENWQLCDQPHLEDKWRQNVIEIL